MKYRCTGSHEPRNARIHLFKAWFLHFIAGASEIQVLYVYFSSSGLIAEHRHVISASSESSFKSFALVYSTPFSSTVIQPTHLVCPYLISLWELFMIALLQSFSPSCINVVLLSSSAMKHVNPFWVPSPYTFQYKVYSVFMICCLHTNMWVGTGLFWIEMGVTRWPVLLCSSDGQWWVFAKCDNYNDLVTARKSLHEIEILTGTQSEQCLREFLSHFSPEFLKSHLHILANGVSCIAHISSSYNFTAHQN